MRFGIWRLFSGDSGSSSSMETVDWNLRPFHPQRVEP